MSQPQQKIEKECCEFLQKKVWQNSNIKNLKPVFYWVILRRYSCWISFVCSPFCVTRQIGRNWWWMCVFEYIVVTWIMILTYIYIYICIWCLTSMLNRDLQNPCENCLVDQASLMTSPRQCQGASEKFQQIQQVCWIKSRSVGRVEAEWNGGESDILSPNKSWATS